MKVWKILTVILVLTLIFVSSSFYFIEDSEKESVIDSPDFMENGEWKRIVFDGSDDIVKEVLLNG